MKLAVAITWRAERDIERNYAWLRAKSKAGADRWFRAFRRKKEWHAQNAVFCGLAPESEKLDRELRGSFFKTRSGNRYRIIFEMDAFELRTLHVRGPGEDFLSEPP